MQGYGNPAYAESLAEFGKPRHLPRSGGWLLERPVAGFNVSDAMGCYPLFVCSDWSQLVVDLANIGGDLISLSLVTDPFGQYDVAYLGECFPEVAIPFKEHFIVDLSQPLDTLVHSHHRRNARRALSRVRVEKCADPLSFLNDWITLYGNLIERHSITGLAAFSPAAFAKQLAVPGIIAFRAVHNEETVGMVLWYEQENRAYYHLAAYSPTGYELRASFALFDYSLRYFAARQCEWLSLGAGAGVDASDRSGLNRFKQGWSTGTRTAYFCGRIFDAKKYEAIVSARGPSTKRYFPAYRAGEFS